MNRPAPAWLYLATAAGVVWWLSDPATPAIFRVWMWMAALVALVIIWAATNHPVRGTR